MRNGPAEQSDGKGPAVAVRGKKALHPARRNGEPDAVVLVYNRRAASSFDSPSDGLGDPAGARVKKEKRFDERAHVTSDGAGEAEVLRQVARSWHSRLARRVGRIRYLGKPFHKCLSGGRCGGLLVFAFGVPNVMHQSFGQLGGKWLNKHGMGVNWQFSYIQAVLHQL